MSPSKFIKMSTIKVNLQLHFYVGSLEVNLTEEENVEVKNFPSIFVNMFSLFLQKLLFLSQLMF